MTIRAATAADLPAINAIYNRAVEVSTASFDLSPFSTDRRRDWFEAHGSRYPVLVADEKGVVAGYADLHPFIRKEGCAHVAEVSVYVREDCRGRGVGKALLKHLVAEGRSVGLTNLLAFCADGNEVSVRLHESLGFRRVGELEDIGHKFGGSIGVTLLQYACGQQE